MNRKNIFWGVALILTAVLIVVNAVCHSLGFFFAIPVAQLIFSAVCVIWAILTVTRRHARFIFFPLALLLIIWKQQVLATIWGQGVGFISNWIILLAALLLCIGFSFLKPHKNNADSTHHFNVNMDRSAKYIDSTDFVSQSVDVDMSGCDIYFENSENYPGNGTLYIDNNMAKTVIHVPSDWHIISNIDNNMGKVSIPSSGNPDGKIININGENNMGKIDVVLI